MNDIRKPMRRLLVTQPAYWYHVSDEDMGDVVTLYPRHSSESTTRLDGEPALSRICVAPNPCMCLCAINYYTDRTYHVYCTQKEVQAVHPYDVEDSQVTKEKWLLKPTTFIHVDIIPVFIMEKLPTNKYCGCGDNFSLQLQRNILKNIQYVFTKHKNTLSYAL